MHAAATRASLLHGLSTEKMWPQGIREHPVEKGRGHCGRLPSSTQRHPGKWCFRATHAIMGGLTTDLWMEASGGSGGGMAKTGAVMGQP